MEIIKLLQFKENTNLKYLKVIKLTNYLLCLQKKLEIEIVYLNFKNE